VLKTLILPAAGLSLALFGLAQQTAKKRILVLCTGNSARSQIDRWIPQIV
jgi:hypothetical protein